MARDLGTTPHTRAMASFWSGWIWYQRGIRTQEPSTAASARQALQAYIHPDLEVLNRQYQAFVRRIVQTGARDAIVEGRSPLERR